jgi:hypothetical protein
MAGRSLAIVERAWRGGIEEQYAHILWLARILKRMRSDVAVLLRGNAVGYAVHNTRSYGVQIAGIELDAIHRLDTAVTNLLADGVPVHVSERDCNRLGIEPEVIVPGVVHVDPAGIVRLCQSYDRVWYW